MIPDSFLPHLNALLNGISAVLLLSGFLFIRRKNKRVHQVFMIAAVAASTLFLISYLVYHAHVGSVRFQGTGWIRPVYFTLLTSHTILAALVVPLVLVTLRRALAAKFERHKLIARWSLPVWLYVSITGVLVYVMLYHL